MSHGVPSVGSYVGHDGDEHGPLSTDHRPPLHTAFTFTDPSGHVLYAQPSPSSLHGNPPGGGDGGHVPHPASYPPSSIHTPPTHATLCDPHLVAYVQYALPLHGEPTGGCTAGHVPPLSMHGDSVVHGTS